MKKLLFKVMVVMLGFMHVKDTCSAIENILFSGIIKYIILVVMKIVVQ